MRTPTETGIYIDGSHRSAFDFMCLVIEMAHDYGFEMEWDAFLSDVEKYRNGEFEVGDDDWIDVSESIEWTYEDALQYLDEITREGVYWEVRDQSLYLVEDADASQ